MFRGAVLCKRSYSLKTQYPLMHVFCAEQSSLLEHVSVAIALHVPAIGEFAVPAAPVMPHLYPSPHEEEVQLQ